MAFKMKGAPMHDTSSKHGTNANYKKSGAPFGLSNILDPAGIFRKRGGGKCPPAAGGDPAAAPAARPAAPAPNAPAQPAAAPMKEGLMTRGTDPRKPRKPRPGDNGSGRPPKKVDPRTDPRYAHKLHQAKKKGAPMTDKPKHQKGGSYTYKGKTYPDFAHLPDAAKQVIYAKNVKEYGGTGGKNRVMTNPDGSLKATGTKNRDAKADSGNTN
jgi:hypothetical protein